MLAKLAIQNPLIAAPRGDSNMRVFFEEKWVEILAVRLGGITTKNTWLEFVGLNIYNLQD